MYASPALRPRTASVPPHTPQMQQSNSVRRVTVDERVTIQVRRDAQEPSSRIAAVHGIVAGDSSLMPGQVLVGASLGSAKVSFVKMPVALVQKELARLKSISKPFSIIVADSMEDIELEMTSRTPETSGRGRLGSANSAVSMPTPGTRQARAHNNPQEVTPPPPKFNLAAYEQERFHQKADVNPMTPLQENRAAFSTPHSTPGRGVGRLVGMTPGTMVASPASVPPSFGDRQEEASIMGMMRSGDVVRIQASLEKLRSQRLAFERTKADSAKKDVRIRALTQQNQQLRNSLAGAQETIDSQGRLYGDLEVALERVQVLETRVEEKEKEIAKAREAARSSESFLMEALDQEKKAREDDRAQAEKDLELAQDELRSEHDRAQSEELRVRELQTRINALEEQLDEARISLEDLRSSDEDRFASAQRELETIKADRDHLYKRNKELEERTETQATTLSDTLSALSTAEQRITLLGSTIEELEENTVLLRKQLHESERKHASVVKDLSERLKDSDQRIIRKQRELDDARTKIKQLEHVREETTADSTDIKQTLMRKDRQLANLQESLQRSQAQNQAQERRLLDTNNKMENLHQRLLAEVSRSANLAQNLEAERRLCRDWASQRLDLLDQFCREEEELSRLAK
mmetsp:Transcript_10415/g.20510  ORF Transcript_10415/g.20510 Transcript_10415/m.20510 type:complete len:637 (+) Transcript_10415:165-2075(+)|eukprot:CAMPEP_0171579312 /NCGR_PEP_ID=MMETSP0961-20121227/8370_1 /TAXON_ID=87120 /ORGANISM="Aurantiochytrium limacinum, Strain ATCCMYA-1381" /LENGTH=636 /DNA_ID=CAMNT_0012135779 /DNA_START=124 /DNA_END=2034 /DNA_ORIENTATION=+